MSGCLEAVSRGPEGLNVSIHRLPTASDTISPWKNTGPREFYGQAFFVVVVFLNSQDHACTTQNVSSVEDGQNFNSFPA